MPVGRAPGERQRVESAQANLREMLSASDMATRTVRWGILGTGAVAGHFAEGLRTLAAARLEAVASRSREKADAFARAFAVPRVHAGYEALVSDREIDAVYVATPNHAHKENVILALEHGKPALCEKPFTLDGAEARAIVEVARRTGCFCMEGMWMRFVPLMRELVPLVRGGAIGDLQMAVASLGFPFEFDAKHRVFDPRQGGGAMLDLGVYALSFVFQFLGRPTHVAAQAVLGRSGVDEQATALLRFPGERQALISTSLRGHLTNDATLLGSGGMVRVHEPLYVPEVATLVRTPARPRDTAAAQAPSRFGILGQHPLLRDLHARLRRVRRETALVRRRQGNGYAHEALEVMRCLEEGERESPVMPLDESVAIMETMDLIRGQWSKSDTGEGP
jgi:predicted dehydrogenase